MYRTVADIFSSTVDALATSATDEKLFYCQHGGGTVPSGSVLREVVELVRAVIFPGYFGEAARNAHTMQYRIGVNIERIYSLLCEQINAGLCFAAGRYSAEERAERSRRLALEFIEYLPELRRKLALDVEAAYNGDPAATDYVEVISCYPAIKAVSNYRMAHKLYKQGVPLLPRIITELAHSETGIDIHPAAEIGDYFTIDHGTGVVIGATCIIGNNVKLYQGVTLGAKSFPLDRNGHPVKGILRHPILEDNVIVYSNATILGRVTIGRGAIIGGNIWVTDSVPAGTQIVQRK